MKETKLKAYGILYGAFFVYSLSAVCSKLAAGQNNIIRFLLFFALEFVFLAVYAIIYQQALKHFSLVVAMSNKGVTVILALLWSVVLFGEHITLFNVLGACAIVLGIGLVSSGD